jgi:uncharacterized protein YqeY
MKIEAQITADIKKSMISRNPKRTTLLRTIIGEFNRIGKDISDEKALSIMKKMKNNAITLNDKIEIEILSEYLPESLTDEETIKIIEDMYKENSYAQRDMGTFMKEIKANYGATVNMKLVSSTFKSYVFT